MQTDYDDIPYESLAYPLTHPPHLYAMATLLGLRPPDYRRARVLELGCAAGGNILPLARAYPEASFLGIDLSGTQIAQAERNKDALPNITFRQQDILTFDEDGPFDYIIGHGVMSWVPEHVGEKVLQICARSLSPNGLALLSYNALPGWNAVRSLREMMIYHTRGIPTADRTKSDRARSFLENLGRAVSPDRTDYKRTIENELNLIAESDVTHFTHDHLEGVNRQFYLHEFVTMAQCHGLAYACDSRLDHLPVEIPEAAAPLLEGVSDPVAREQYIDFVLNRRFRSSILCRVEAAPSINRNPRPEQIMDYALTTRLSVDGLGAPNPAQPVTFKYKNNGFTTQNATAATLFLNLIAAGKKPVAATALIAQTQARLGLADPAPVKKVLLNFGIKLALRGLIDIHPLPPSAS